MPQQTMVLIALLLTAAVMYGYFYFKKAEARTPRSGNRATKPAANDADRTNSTPES
jgi:hypothetical protein